MTTETINRPALDSGRFSVALDPWVAFAFLMPFSGLFFLDIGGKLYLQDAIGVALLAFLILQRDSLPRLGLLRGLWGFMLLWLLSLMITDIWRATPVEDIQRGWFKILFFSVQIAALWLLLTRRFAYIVAFGVGSGIAKGIDAVYFSEFSEYAIRFGLATGIAMVPAAIFSLWFSRSATARSAVIAVLGVVAVGVLLQNARSAFGNIALTAAFSAVASMLILRPKLTRRITPSSFALFLLAGVLVGQGLLFVYETAAESGALGNEARVKYLDQGQGDVSILVGGRVESLVTIEAIQDSPILGHGSWAKDPYYARLLRYRMKLLGLKYIGDVRKIKAEIPSHSFFFGSWMEAGVLGGVFWLYVAWIGLVCFYRMIKLPFLALPLITFQLFSLFWNIPFSPFGSFMRFETAFQIVLIGWLLHGYAGRQVVVPRNWLAFVRNGRPVT